MTGPAVELIRRLDQAIAPNSYVVDILLVDDGSIQDYRAVDFRLVSDTEKHTDTSFAPKPRSPARHRCRLVHIEREIPCDAVLVMDGDGETRRKEPCSCCTLFGKDCRFCQTEPANRVHYVPSVLSPVQDFPFLPYRRARAGWKLQHSAVRLSAHARGDARTVESLCRRGLSFRLPFTAIPIPRGHRIAGESKMNFVSLIVHGMSAISVFGTSLACGCWSHLWLVRRWLCSASWP